MNVYDFDGTIYDGDSTLDFWLYCLKKQPVLFLYAPKQIWYFFMFKFRLTERAKFKEIFYGFLPRLKQPEKTIKQFWRTGESRIMKWYKKQRRNDDIIITASPEFLLAPVCKRLHIRQLIASTVDIQTGKLLSPNNRGSEKVRRFRQCYPDSKIDCFYSDSLSDLPLAKLARQAFFCRNGKISKWNTEE